MPWICVGIIIGISFIAQPVKFMTAGVGLAQLVAVGSTIFHISHALQLAMLALFVVMLLTSSAAPVRHWVCMLLFGGTLALQELFLMPRLDARLALMLAGNLPERSAHHAVYVVAELLKISALYVFARGGAERVSAAADRRQPIPQGGSR